MDTALRGSWAYLDPRHDRAALLRSALEGVALTTRAAWAALRDAGCSATVLRLAGGGTTAPAWQQMLADSLDVALEPVDEAAASGRGAALLAGRAAGLFDETEALSLVAPTGRSRRITPVEPAVATNRERFARFERLVLAVRTAS